MKVFPAEIATLLSSQTQQRPRLGTLLRFLSFLVVMIVVYASIFHFLMAREGQDHSWVTSFYWVLTVMSTLGFGDITFHTDVGRLFSILVLASGMLFLLVLLPFIFIEFFYQPWMEAQKASRTPRAVPDKMRGHVLMTHFDPLSAALVEKLQRYGYPYALISDDAEQALLLLDRGYQVVYGDLDLPETYRAARADHAALIAATGSDTQNTNVAFTARDVAPDVRVVATAEDTASIDILELAGCDRVLYLADQLGTALARRISGGDAKTHVIGDFDGLLIAEANVARSEIVGQTLLQSGLREESGVTVVGIWERGQFTPARPETIIDDHSVLLLAGTREQLERYDEIFGQMCDEEQLVLILGGGRVGRAAARVLDQRGIDYRIVEKNPSRPDQDGRWVIGNAADLMVLEKARIVDATSALVTTHEDDTNIYLTLYLSKLRPDIQILSRAGRDRNVKTLHRAGADIVLSYATMGASMLFNNLEKGDTVLVAEGLMLFRVEVPTALEGRTLANSSIRQRTGATVVALETSEAPDGPKERVLNPPADTPLRSGDRLILVGAPEAEDKFLTEF